MLPLEEMGKTTRNPSVLLFLTIACESTTSSKQISVKKKDMMKSHLPPTSPPKRQQLLPVSCVSELKERQEEGRQEGTKKDLNNLEWSCNVSK